MIDPLIQDLEKIFFDLFPDDERCRLDLSWSSVALLDLFLRPLRNRTSYNPNDLGIIKQVATYCAIFSKNVFDAIGQSYELKVSDNSVDLDGLTRQNFFPHLVDRLQLPVAPPEYLVQNSSVLTKEESFLTSWLKEIITNEIVEAQSDTQPASILWEKVQIYLANAIYLKSAARFTSLPAWSEKLISSSPMLIPPFEGSKASRRYESYFKILKETCSSEVVEWRSVGSALLEQADPELALFGAAIRITLDESQVIVSSFNDKKLALEIAEIVRNLQVTFFSQKIWPRLLNPNSIGLAIESLNWERERGLTPFLSLNSELIGFPILHQLFFDIALGSIPNALQSLALLIPKAPPEIQSQLLLQQMYLAVEFGDVHYTEAVAQNISKIAAKLHSEEQALFFYLCGRLQLLLEEPSKARALFQRSLSFGKFTWTEECLIYFLNICFSDSDFSNVVLLSGDTGFSKAVDTELLLLRIISLEKIQRSSDAESELKKAREKSPFSSKLFLHYLSTRLRNQGH